MKGNRIDAYFKKVGDGQASKPSPHVKAGLAPRQQSSTASKDKHNSGHNAAEVEARVAKVHQGQEQGEEHDMGQPAAGAAPTPPRPVEVVVLDGAHSTPATTSVRKRLLTNTDTHELQEDTTHKRQKPADGAAGGGQPAPILHICLASDSDSPTTDQKGPADKGGSNQLGGSTQPPSFAMSGGQMVDSPAAQHSNTQQQPGSVSHTADHTAEACSMSQLATPSAAQQAPQAQPATGPLSQPAGDSQQPNTWTLDDLSATIEDTKAALSQELLLPVTKAAPQALQVAAFIEGRRCTLPDLLTALSDHLSSVMQHQPASDEPAAAAAEGGGGGGGSSSLGSATGSSLREQVLDLACRKAYGVKEGLPEGVAAAGDTDPDAYWFWELREHKKALTAAGSAGGNKAGAAASAAAATSNKKLTDLYRKRRKELRERLAAALALHELLLKLAESQQEGGEPGGRPGRKPAVPGGKALQQRIIKAAAKLDKLPSLNQVDASLECGISALGDKDSTRVAQLAAKQAERQAVREEAEARRAADKAREAADKEAAKAAKDAIREAKAAGFNNAKELEKSKAMMASFLKLPVKTPNTTGTKQAGAPQVTPSPVDLPRACTAPGTAERQAGAAGGEAGGGGGAGTRNVQSCQQPCQPFSARLAQLVDVTRAELDQVLPGPGKPPVAEVQVLLMELRERWRQEARSNRRPCRGAPPSWARRSGPQPTLHERCVALWGDSYQPAAVRVIRRKLLAFADNLRPPYYGSWSRTSCTVRPRRPLGRDLSLDYEVDSDQEWEEEPEGTDLEACSDDEGSEVRGGAEGGEEEEEGEGFVVDDGYLSGDEGVRLEEDAMDVDGTCDGSGAGAGGKTPAGAGASGCSGADARLSALEAGVLRALKSNRPLVLCALPRVVCDPPSAMDAKLLQVLAGSVLRPGVVIRPPGGTHATPPPGRDDCAAPGQQAPHTLGSAAHLLTGACTAQHAAGGDGSTGGGASGGGGAGGGGGHRGRVAQPFPELLIPQLYTYLMRATEKGIDKVVEGFLASLAAAHPPDPAAAPLPHASKKATKECIKQMASYVAGRGWVIKTDLAAPGAAAAFTTPGSKSAAGVCCSSSHTTPAPTPHVLHANAASAGVSSAAGQLLQHTAHKLLPTSVARAAATQLLAAGAPTGGQAVPAGAPTPFPTPNTTFPAPGGVAGARLVATGAVQPPTGAPSTQPWRFAPLHGHPLATGTPVSPIPCPLELAQAPSMPVLTPTHGGMTAAGTPLPVPPANTPASKPGGAASVTSHLLPPGLLHRPPLAASSDADAGAGAARGGCVDLTGLSTRIQQLVEGAGQAAGATLDTLGATGGAVDDGDVQMTDAAGA